jgi:transcriptional regulator NrdR family protein
MCGSKTKVLETRLIDGTSRRRRECLDCGFRFYTRERVERATGMITNMERVCSMTERQLAKAINKYLVDDLCELICDNIGCKAKNNEQCIGFIVDWLKKEAAE